MAPILPVKKIYVDSQFMTSDSVSASNFKIQLPFSVELPKTGIFLIDDVCIPHTWYTIETGINDLLYVYIYLPSPATPFSAVFQIPPGNYNGITFATALQSVLGSSPAPLTVTYNSMTANITVSLPATTTSAVWFKILTDNDIATKLDGSFTSTFSSAIHASSSGNIASLNDILRNYGNSPKYINGRPYVSGFLNLSPINNLYLSSPNLGTFTTLSPTGSMNIIKKIPVSSDFGYMIIDRVVSGHDYLECGGQSLRTLEFNLRDSKGNYVPMHGDNISFSIIFSTQLEDQ